MRKSRRWLLASMGASAVAAIGRADDQKVGLGPAKPGEKSGLATQVDCEALYAQDVKLGHWVPYNPLDPAPPEDRLLDVIDYGFNYEYDGSFGTLPPFKIAFKQHLRDAYLEGIGSALGSNWPMCVAQAFILGQLTRYFWTKSQSGALKALRFRHLASAWAVFGRATSSIACAEWVKHPNLGNKRNAYVLPLLLPGHTPAPTGQQRVFQIDQGCALCN